MDGESQESDLQLHDEAGGTDLNQVMLSRCSFTNKIIFYSVFRLQLMMPNMDCLQKVRNTLITWNMMPMDLIITRYCGYDAESLKTLIFILFLDSI
jgi:hypothetical protein